MGGGGDYYDRDVTPRREIDAYNGFSQRANLIFKKKKASGRRCDPAMNPRDRRLVCPEGTTGALAMVFDVTGSMGSLPRVVYDKMPMITGELLRRGYLGDSPRISLAAVGDVTSDRAPIQVADFEDPRKLDLWLKKMYLEHGGGGTGKESYEFAAYAYAENCDLSAVPRRIFLITGDEDYYDMLEGAKLRKHFGGDPIPAFTPMVFNKLRNQFGANVFHIHRVHRGQSEGRILSRWRSLLGEKNVVMLPEDMAIADVVLGIVAVCAANRTLDEYIAEMKERDQSSARIKAVRGCLAGLAEEVASKNKDTAAQMSKPSKTEEKKTGKKPGRL